MGKIFHIWVTYCIEKSNTSIFKTDTAQNMITKEKQKHITPFNAVLASCVSLEERFSVLTTPLLILYIMCILYNTFFILHTPNLLNASCPTWKLTFICSFWVLYHSASNKWNIPVTQLHWQCVKATEGVLWCQLKEETEWWGNQEPCPKTGW